LISALFPSADGALTALTSSFCIDILGLKRNELTTEKEKKKTRLTVHFTFAIIFFIIVMAFKAMDSKSIIDIILKVAGFTYGPLLGLFAFGMLTTRKINDKLSLLVCLLAPLIILGVDFINNIEWWQRQLKLEDLQVQNLKSFSSAVFGEFKIGTELLIYNGILTFIGLFIISNLRKFQQTFKPFYMVLISEDINAYAEHFSSGRMLFCKGLPNTHGKIMASTT
jgi:hypothetical protein